MHTNIFADSFKETEQGVTISLFISYDQHYKFFSESSIIFYCGQFNISDDAWWTVNKRPDWFRTGVWSWYLNRNRNRNHHLRWGQFGLFQSNSVRVVIWLFWIHFHSLTNTFRHVCKFVLRCKNLHRIDPRSLARIRRAEHVIKN